MSFETEKAECHLWRAPASVGAGDGGVVNARAFNIAADTH
jgi:hypothetical protein